MTIVMRVVTKVRAMGVGAASCGRGKTHTSARTAQHRFPHAHSLVHLSSPPWWPPQFLDPVFFTEIINRLGHLSGDFVAMNKNKK